MTSDPPKITSVQRVNAQRGGEATRRAKQEPTVVDWGQAWDRVERILKEVYGE